MDAPGDTEKKRAYLHNRQFASSQNKQHNGGNSTKLQIGRLGRRHDGSQEALNRTFSERSADL